MSYNESNIECDWCSKPIKSGADVACRKCYEALEQKVAELEKEIETLNRELDKAGADAAGVSHEK